MQFVWWRPPVSLACASLVLGIALSSTGPSPARALQFDPAPILQLAKSQYGPQGFNAVFNWLDLLSSQAAAPETSQLRAVNDFWNRHVRAGEDTDIWSRQEYWATPLQTLGKQAGDCEDFVIGKYFSLVQLGVSPAKLRLIYVRAQVGGQSIAHMVLGYYETPGSDPLILDNLNHAIRPASTRTDLRPVFSFSADTVYVAGTAAGGVERITRWQAVLDRMSKEGFRP